MRVPLLILRGVVLAVTLALMAGALITYTTGPASAGTPGEYVPLTPTRIANTNNGLGIDQGAGPLASGDSAAITVPLLGVGGIPTSGVEAVELTVTVVAGATTASELTVYPTGQARPNTTTLIFGTSDLISNQTIVPPGAGGKVTVYNKTGYTHVLLDVVGYFTDGSTAAAGGTYQALEPAQHIVDTRYGIGGTGPIAAGTPLTVTAGGVAGVPTNATAAAVNVVAHDPTGTGSMTFTEDGASPNGLLNQVVYNGQSIAAFAIVKLSSEGKFIIHHTFGTHLAVNVQGYFTNSSQGNAYYSSPSPTRIVDSRDGTGLNVESPAPLATGTVTSLSSVGEAVPTEEVTAITVTLTSYDASNNGPVTLLEEGEDVPLAASQRAIAGDNVSNTVVVPVDKYGDFAIAMGTTAHVTIDVVGYFADYTTNRFAPNVPIGVLPAEGELVPTVTPTLHAQFSDDDKSEGAVLFGVYNSAGTTLLAGGQGTVVTDVAESTWTVPPGVLVNGGTYKLAARAHDGELQSAPTTMTTFTVDTSLPVAPTIPPLQGTVVGGAAPPDEDVSSLSSSSDAFDNIQHLYGFNGPYFDVAAQSSTLRVIENSVSTPSSGDWSGLGLVRNETTADVGPITVTARLYDGNDQLLATRSAVTDLDTVRPGEPVPFSITSTTSVSQIARVEWDASATASGAKVRKLEHYLNMEYPAGNRDPVVGGWSDTGSAPYPHVALGDIANRSDSPITSLRLQMAWIDGEGRLLYATDLTEPETPDLDPNEHASFVIAIPDSPVAQSLADATPLIWSQAS